jgi:hypothetical protein
MRILIQLFTLIRIRIHPDFQNNADLQILLCLFAFLTSGENYTVSLPIDLII